MNRFTCKRKKRTTRKITITMARTMDKFTKKFLSHSLKGLRTTERRGEYDRKKMGTKRNPTTLQTTFFGLCIIVRTIVAPNATTIITTKDHTYYSLYQLFKKICPEVFLMERNIPTDIKAKVRENTSANMKTTKKGLELRIGIPVS